MKGEGIRIYVIDNEVRTQCGGVVEEFGQQIVLIENRRNLLYAGGTTSVSCAPCRMDAGTFCC